MTTGKLLGHLLRKHRQAAGLSMSAVARALTDAGVGRSRQSVYVWEKGAADPPAEVLRALVEVYALTAGQKVEIFNAAGLLVIVPTEAA
jgi:predicted transcriptional regulator